MKYISKLSDLDCNDLLRDVVEFAYCVCRRTVVSEHDLRVMQDWMRELQGVEPETWLSCEEKRGACRQIHLMWYPGLPQTCRVGPPKWVHPWNECMATSPPAPPADMPSGPRRRRRRPI